ncbi:unnamed protein product [Kuraishia capsulata CBS 1993]|uniref:Phytanoyl-CoA dioxygenase n=1 Tax=Kuraishia capsulata CBS 1993 TaxID=1382522 RepID=W6MQ83_9ASCO|nr:uncharacterized protein KUCA_T00000010001 [Kuraishia capsulata CBS 1993]CDK24050.1 unnamed protein product [Kuraishia capsulata CBS 1993]
MTVAEPTITFRGTSSTYNDIELFREGEIGKAKVLNRVKDDRVLKPTAEDLTVSEPVTADKIAEKLEIYGGCRVKNYLPTEVADQIWNEVEPYFGGGRKWEGDFFPKETSRVCGIMNKSKTACERYLTHPLLTEVAARFLGKENAFIMGQELITAYSAPQLNSSVTFNIGPGAHGQPLHRDDIIHHNIRKYREKYEYGSETALGCMLAHSTTTYYNGATKFIPGSHLWDHYRVPSEDECVYAEMEKGDAFFMLASCFHGGHANTTKDEQRKQSILFMTQGVLRQEENLYLETPLDYFKTLSVDAVKAFGIPSSDPKLGYVGDLVNPLYLVKPELENEKGADDPFEKTYQLA